DDPEPYSFPAMTKSGTLSAMYFTDASKIDICSPDGRCRVTPPSDPGASWFLRRTFANVPRTMTSGLPRREPYELKSAFATPPSGRYLPAGPSALIDPAGEMWSVVMLSPSTARTRAFAMGATGGGSDAIPSK